MDNRIINQIIMQILMQIINSLHTRAVYKKNEPGLEQILTPKRIRARTEQKCIKKYVHLVFCNFICSCVSEITNVEIQ